MGGRGSGLLADELDGPTTPFVIPALRFGFAINGGGCVFENTPPCFRSIAKKCYSSQALAGLESVTPDTSDTIRDRDTRQAAAAVEGPIPDASNAIRNRDACEASAA